MACVMHLCIAVFILTVSHLNHVDANVDKYVDLIYDIRNGYSTSSVFFIFSRYNSPMQTYTTAHSSSLVFSERGVFTLTSHFDRLNKRLNYYHKRVGRPLVVILLKSLDDVNEFNNGTRETDKSYPIWLVIFYGSSDDPFCEFCRGPVENTFRLRFDTLWLVVCCDDPTIREWWSVNGNRTETGIIGIWSANGTLDFLAIKGLNARRHNVFGTGLRVVIATDSPSTHDSGHHVDGFFGAVFRELQQAMNFTVTAMYRVNGFDEYNATMALWYDALGMLIRKEADLMIADLTMTASRLNVIDFTSPLLLTRTKLFIREPDSMSVHWFAYFEAFASQIWMTLIVLIITTPLLLTFIRVKRGSTSLGSLYFEYYLSVWGIFCQQGLLAFPAETSMRIAYFSIFVSALVVSAVYSASLISFLTVTSSTLPFTDLVGFVKDGSYKLIVYQNSSEYDFFDSSTDLIFAGMRALMKPWKELPFKPRLGWDQVCNERVALFTTDLDRRAMNTTCRIVGIDTGGVDNLAIGLPAGSQYNEVVNYHIQRFKANGIFARLTDMYYNDEISIETTYDAVKFSRVAPILLILAVGIILAFIVWTCETIYYENSKRCHSRRIESSRNVMQRSLQGPKFEPKFIGYYP